MKSKEQEHAALEAFQERWKDASREALLKRMFGAQHQATFYTHQISAFPEAAQTAGGPACLCQAAHRPHRPGEISDQHAQMFLQQVLGEQAFRASLITVRRGLLPRNQTERPSKRKA